MTKILKEGLNHLDMENFVFPVCGVDQFSSSVGKDDDMITLNFAVKDEKVAEDLAEWFERGYEWVIDAEPSPGEITRGKYYVYVEISRRTNAPRYIMELIRDLETLTDLSPSEWKLVIGESLFPATEEIISAKIPLSPHQYRSQSDESLNEWRQIAGIDSVTQATSDPDLQSMQRQAGII